MLLYFIGELTTRQISVLLRQKVGITGSHGSKTSGMRPITCVLLLMYLVKSKIRIAVVHKMEIGFFQILCSYIV